MVSDRQASNILIHTQHRMMKYARFASKSLPSQSQKTYMNTVWYLHEWLANHDLPSTHKTIFSMFNYVKEATYNIPVRKYTVVDAIIGTKSDDRYAVKLALEHILDLVWSYRRFQGIPLESVGMSYPEWARQIVSDHLLSHFGSSIK